MRGLIFVAALLSTPAFADDIVLRMAAIAPDGTGWAREVRALAREVESGTDGAVRMRWYLGAIAGDEPTALERIRRGQLDGFAGASSCLELAPTLKVTRVVGVVQSRAEGLFLINQLRGDIDAEFKRAGFKELAMGGFGVDVLFLRDPIRTMAEARKTPLWVWSVDELVKQQMTTMGLHLVPADVDKLGELFDSGQVDAMFAIPSAALAFQWTPRARYFIDLRASYLPGCLVLAQRAFDQLSFEQQQLLQSAANKFAKRFEESGQRDEELLLGSLLERQGLKRIKASESFRDEFFSAAHEARTQIPPDRVSPSLITRALSILGDFRGEHP